MRIVFEFFGGPLDGKTVAGDFGQQGEAERYYFLSHHGLPGQRFKVASDYAVETLAREQLKVETRHNFQRHFYQITERQEFDDEVFLRADYVPASADKDGNRSS